MVRIVHLDAAEAALDEEREAINDRATGVPSGVSQHRNPTRPGDNLNRLLREELPPRDVGGPGPAEIPLECLLRRCDPTGGDERPRDVRASDRRSGRDTLNARPLHADAEGRELVHY
jgi:hypothetical protein